MLEGYWAQPSKLENNNLQHVYDEEINSLKKTNAPINHPQNTFGNSKKLKIETPKRDANPTYSTPLDLKKGRTKHSLNDIGNEA